MIRRVIDILADIAGAVLLAASIYLPVLWDSIQRGY